MFKYARNLLEKGAAQAEPVFDHKVEPSPLMQGHAVQDNFQTMEFEEPETTIGPNVTVKGTLAFERLLRIDGSFEGTLESKAKLIIGPTGYVKADIDLQEAYISGKVEGNIIVKEKLVLRGRAEIVGNITAPLLSVDEGVSIIGQVYVTAPQGPSDPNVMP
jgi:cytoskeletal protein CcmA (bactofilin family)